MPVSHMGSSKTKIEASISVVQKLNDIDNKTVTSFYDNQTNTINDQFGKQDRVMTVSPKI